MKIIKWNNRHVIIYILKPEKKKTCFITSTSAVVHSILVVIEIQVMRDVSTVYFLIQLNVVLLQNNIYILPAGRTGEGI